MRSYIFVKHALYLYVKNRTVVATNLIIFPTYHVTLIRLREQIG